MSEIHSTYPFTVRWLEGKSGVASAPDGLPDIPVSSPPQFGGPPGRWSPEHLFVGAATTCWLTTFLAYADRARLELVAVEASAEAFVEKDDEGKVHLSRIVLRPSVTIRQEGEREKADKFIRRAEETCLIARAMRATVELEPEIRIAS